MATPAELAERVLRKAKVIGLYETAQPEEIQQGINAVRDAHNMLNAQGLLRWTLQDIPAQAELGYIHIGATLAADVFGTQIDPAWMQLGLRQIQSFVNVPATYTGCTEDF